MATARPRTALSESNCLQVVQPDFALQRALPESENQTSCATGIMLQGSIRLLLASLVVATTVGPTVHCASLQTARQVRTFVLASKQSTEYCYREVGSITRAHVASGPSARAVLA